MQAAFEGDVVHKIGITAIAHAQKAPVFSDTETEAGANDTGWGTKILNWPVGADQPSDVAIHPGRRGFAASGGTVEVDGDAVAALGEGFVATHIRSPLDAHVHLPQLRHCGPQRLPR